MRHLAIAAILLAAACSPAVKAEIAKDSYQADQKRCVTEYDTPEEIDACRAYERARWGKATVNWPLADAGIRDAGGDR